MVGFVSGILGMSVLIQFQVYNRISELNCASLCRYYANTSYKYISVVWM